MKDSVRPYQISVADSELDDLKRRLLDTRWPEQAPVDDWSQGIPLDYLQDVCAYWANGYDWRATERRLNAYPQFLTTIDDVEIHFLHIRSSVQSAMPLLLTHGWPGSIIEFSKVIEALTNPAKHGGEQADAFHLVIPCLPGYGFSGKPAKTGWGVESIATAWAALMPRLGYPRYLAQGGDWGAAITTAIGIQDPSNCIAIHVNMPLVGPDKSTFDNLTTAEQSALDGAQFYQDWDSGYSKQQSTRPQTVGYGLTDSPSGQAAWILEKFYQWTDCDGHPENILTRDELLDNVMLYWLNRAAASSARLYWESFGQGRRDAVSIPSGISIFPKEIFRTSRRWAERRYQNLIHWNELDKGGHFAAFEQPASFVNEIRTCFRHVR
jgi:pimeloyl-ACP methyl ester carboxylesterase